jgi:hypothetical protein
VRITQVTIVNKEVHRLEPGEATYDTGAWFIGCPSNSGLHGDIGNLAGHEVTYDGVTLTVSPSILCGCGAHYFVERNQIRWC